VYLLSPLWIHHSSLIHLFSSSLKCHRRPFIIRRCSIIRRWFIIRRLFIIRRWFIIRRLFIIRRWFIIRCCGSTISLAFTFFNLIMDWFFNINHPIIVYNLWGGTYSRAKRHCGDIQVNSILMSKVAHSVELNATDATLKYIKPKEIFFGDIYSPSKCPSVFKLSYDWYLHEHITGDIQVNIKTSEVVNPSELKFHWW